MDHYRSFFKGNAFILLGQFLIVIQALALTPIIVKATDARTYGGYIILMSLLSFVFGISSFGIGFRCKRYLPSSADRASKRALYYPQFIFQLVSIVLLALLLGSEHRWLESTLFKHEFSLPALLATSYLVAQALYSQSTDYFRYTGRMLHFACATTVQPYLVIGTVIGIYYLTRQLTVSSLLFAHFFATGVVATFVLVLKVREIGLPCSSMSLPLFRQDLRLGLPLLLAWIVDYVLGVGDRYIIAFFLSVEEIGYYQPAYALGSLMLLFPRVSGVVLPPFLSRFFDASQTREAKRIVDYTIRSFLILAIPFVAGSLVLGKRILTVYCNADVAQHAFWVFPIVAAATLFYGLSLILTNVLFVTLKTRVIFRVNALAAAANLMLNIAFIPMFRNIKVAAFATLISYAVSFVLILRMVSSEWEVNFSLPVIAKSVLGSLVMGTVVFLVDNLVYPGTVSPGLLMGEVALAVLVYAAVLIGTNTFSKKELAYFRSLLQPAAGRV